MLTFVKCSKPIPAVAIFKYFEIEVSSNPDDKPIYAGIVEARDNYNHTPNSWLEIGGKNSLLINGGTGEIKHGDHLFKLDANLSLNEAGDTIGVCFHL